MIKNFISKLFKQPTVISFKQGLDLTDLPICTFKCGENKLNFMLDTGSTANVIDSRIVDRLNVYNIIVGKDTLTGIGGKMLPSKSCMLDIEYGNNTYSARYLISDVSAPFDVIKGQFGVTVHGILGSIFFQKYKYVIDFDSLIAYSKK